MYYNQQMWAQYTDYQANQEKEVLKATKAYRDLCQAAKKLDRQHQQAAAVACLAVFLEELGR